MYDIITFDCYGTLIDWENGITHAFLGAGIGDPLDRHRILELYHGQEPAIEASYRSYREVLGETAKRVASALRMTLDDAKAAFLAESLPSWRPFPDTNAALERMRAAGIRLGILSNVDDDLFAGTRRHFTVDFDLVITAQQVCSYKPGQAHFLAARERIGGARWLHAAQSHFHDVVPARDLGIPIAWINRKNERPATYVLPDKELRDLAGLAEWVCGG
jgi:2-haloalkanoic acid dehalogenase type II